MPMTRNPTPASRYAERCRAAAAEARAAGLDGLVVWGRGGETGEAAGLVLFYANHFSAYPGQPPAEGLTGIEHAAVVIDGEGASTLLVSHFTSEDAVADETRASMDLYGLLEETLRETGLAQGRVGVVGSEAFPFPLAQRLGERLAGLTLVAADELGERQRSVLGDGDLELLENAAEVGTRIVQAICDAAQPGVTEGEAVGAGLALAATVPGCVHWAFMIASGPDQHLFVRSGTPAWNPTYVYRAGDVLHVDAYGFVFGAQYDLMRTVVVGAEPTPGQRRVVEGSRDLIGAVASRIRDGVTPAELVHAGAEFAADAGLDVSGSTTYGHGMNAGWMAPWLQPPLDRPDMQQPLSAPRGFAFETFVTDGEGNYAKWEDTYAWLPSGVRRLTGAEPGPELAAPLVERA